MRCAVETCRNLSISPPCGRAPTTVSGLRRPSHSRVRDVARPGRHSCAAAHAGVRATHPLFLGWTKERAVAVAAFLPLGGTTKCRFF